MEKEAAVSTFEYFAQRLGEPLHDAQRGGGRRFGGHTLRVTGAESLGALGVGLPLIKSLARWESEVIMRYLKDAHLAGLTNSVTQLLSGKVQGPSGTSTANTVCGLRSRA